VELQFALARAEFCDDCKSSFWEKMVDLVGIEPTTFPAGRDALKLRRAKLVSIPESNDVDEVHWSRFWPQGPRDPEGDRKLIEEIKMWVDGGPDIQSHEEHDVDRLDHVTISRSVMPRKGRWRRFSEEQEEQTAIVPHPNMAATYSNDLGGSFCGLMTRGKGH
jgi:hypothetical protein